jgi:hypothetical protein
MYGNAQSTGCSDMRSQTHFCPSDATFPQRHGKKDTEGKRKGERETEMERTRESER